MELLFQAGLAFPSLNIFLRDCNNSSGRMSGPTRLHIFMATKPSAHHNHTEILQEYVPPQVSGQPLR